VPSAMSMPEVDMEGDGTLAMTMTATKNKISSQNTRIKRDMVNQTAANQTKEIYSKVNESFRRKANETKLMIEQLERAENKTMLEIDQMELSIQSMREASRKLSLPAELCVRRVNLRTKLPPSEAGGLPGNALEEEKAILSSLQLDIGKAINGSKEMLSILSNSLGNVGSALLDKREGYFRDLEALGMSPGHEGKNVTIYQPSPPANSGFARSISPRKKMNKSQSVKKIQPKGTPAMDPATLDAFRKSFQNADKDGNGTISVSEFTSVYKDAGVDLGEMADSMHDRIDTDDDDRINFDEFVTHMAKVRVSLQQKQDGAAPTPDTNDGTTVGWRNDTKNVFQSTMATVGQSQSCRNQNKRFFEYLSETIPALAKKTQLAFRNRISQNSTMRDNLSARVSETQLELKQQARCADRLKKAIAEKREPLDVCQSRIAHRQTRPARELVRDQVTQVLEVEYQHLSEAMTTLEQELGQCTDEIKMLRASLKELQEGFASKTLAIKIDNQCVNLRKKMEAEARNKTRRGQPTLVLP